MQARYYDPVIGRFYSNDPVGYTTSNPVMSFNRYLYVNNNPYRYVDPDGNYIESAWDAASLSVGLVSLGSNLMNGNWGAAGLDAIGVIADGAALALPLVPGGAGIAIGASRKGADIVLSNSDNVVRGGTNTADRFTNGSKVTTNADGTLSGVSVNSAPGSSVEQLSQGIPNGQIGVTTVGDIRAAGGNVTPSPTNNNPNHCTVCGISAEKAQELFTPTIKNPSN